MEEKGKNYVRVDKCRVCGSEKLLDVLNMGMQTVIAFPDKPDASLPKAPLELVMCQDCTLVQLRYSFDRNKLYTEYWYESGISPIMVKALNDVVSKATGIIKVKENDIVVDIGSNDSTLLNQYEQKVLRIGFEPSNVARTPKNGGEIIHTFFNSKSYFEKVKKKASIITSCAMFYDLDNPNEFVDDITKCLDQNGLLIIQMNYLGLIIKNRTFDDICHEHREFYSFKALEYLLGRHSLEAFDVEMNDVNGGSIRAYIKHASSGLKVEGGAKRLEELRLWERDIKLAELGTYKDFAKAMEENKKKILEFVKIELGKGKLFYVEGCSTRGLTQMQYLGLDSRQIKYGIEKNPRKFGKYYADTGIKIISPSENLPIPDYKMVLPYHFIEKIKSDNKEFMANGGKLFVAIPDFKVIS